MRKQTKLQKVSRAKVKPKPRTGPAREKVQITVRVDQQLINACYAQMKEDNSRITDMIERGLILALTEAQHHVPQFTAQIRFLLANCTKDQAELIRGLAIALVEDEVRTDEVPEVETRLFETLVWYLQSRNSQPHAHKALELYSRYGKSAEEIAKMRA